MDAMQPYVKWWQTTALLEVEGPDAATLLDGLCTQAVTRIEPGSARLGLFLDAKASIIAPTVLHRVDHGGDNEPTRLLLETLPECLEPLSAHLRRYRLRAKATIEPSDLSTIAVIGPGAPALAASGDVTARTSRTGYGSVVETLFASADLCPMLIEQLVASGAQLADPDELEASRIEAGHADLHDLLPGRMPAEVGGMTEAVALDAGCYLGQEPVARLHYRGRANRALRRLTADGPLTITPPADGRSPLELRPAASPDAGPVGQLTTWARRADGSTVAFAMLRREVAPGEPLIPAGGELELSAIDDHA